MYKLYGVQKEGEGEREGGGKGGEVGEKQEELKRMQGDENLAAGLSPLRLLAREAAGSRDQK